MSRRVLLVDDSDDVRELAALSLRHIANWDVVEARSGEEALALARRQRPDVVLLDVMMPGMDGPTTLDALRAEPELADLPVVFLTARTGAADVEGFLARGALGVVEKPFDPMTLADTIRNLLEGSR